MRGVRRRTLAETEPGQRFGPLLVGVDRPRLMAYAAASGDHNRIHWDEAFARSVGLPGVIAHGMWTMGAAGELVAQWAGDPTAFVDYRVKFTAPVLVPSAGNAQVEVRGTVKKVVPGGDPGPPTAVVELSVTCGGEKVLSRALATVQLAEDAPA